MKSRSSRRGCLLGKLVTARQRVAAAIRAHATELGLDLRGSDALELMGNLSTLQPIHNLALMFVQPVPFFRLIKRWQWFALVLMSVEGINELMALWNMLPEFKVRSLWGLAFPWVGFWLWNLWKRNGRALRPAAVQVAGNTIRFPWHSRFHTVRSVSRLRTARGTTLRFAFEEQPEWLEFGDVPEELLQLLSAAGVPISEEITRSK